MEINMSGNIKDYDFLIEKISKMQKLLISKRVRYNELIELKVMLETTNQKTITINICGVGVNVGKETLIELVCNEISEHKSNSELFCSQIFDIVGVADDKD